MCGRFVGECTNEICFLEWALSWASVLSIHIFLSFYSFNKCSVFTGCCFQKVRSVACLCKLQLICCFLFQILWWISSQELCKSTLHVNKRLYGWITLQMVKFNYLNLQLSIMILVLWLSKEYLADSLFLFCNNHHKFSCTLQWLKREYGAFILPKWRNLNSIN